ncbi:MAG TPA: DUF4350 domain-containing protein [Acidimicrobiales bacterium]|nr:DUF4350 domain-containing protein [Acidimicrobiales bacterium]
MTVDGEHFAPGLSTNSSAFADVWRRLPRLGRLALWLVAISLVYQVAASLVSGISGSPPSVTGQGSSLDTTSSGTAAFARLLSINGHQVKRLSSKLSPGSRHEFGELFTLDATSWSSDNTRAIQRLLALGDTVTVSGQIASIAVLQRFAPESKVRWSSFSANTVTSFANSAVVAGVKQVASPGPGTFVVTHAGSGLIILARGSGGVLALAIHHGGLLIVLASSSPLWNQNLASYDNAAFGLNLAAPPHSVVAFDEYAHGVGAPGSGFAALPSSWRIGLAAIALSLLVWIISASRRFGPPQETDRRLLPPRIGYVNVMATRLSTRPNDEIEASTDIVRSELRITLARRFGLPVDASDELLQSVASYSADGRSVVAELVALAMKEPPGGDDALGAARALAVLHRPRGDPWGGK